MTTSAKVALGICGAITAGVVISLLVAPEKSKEITKRIRKTAGKWVDKMGNVFSKVENEAAELKFRPRQIRTTMD